MINDFKDKKYVFLWSRLGWGGPFYLMEGHCQFSIETYQERYKYDQYHDLFEKFPGLKGFFFNCKEGGVTLPAEFAPSSILNSCKDELP